MIEFGIDLLDIPMWFSERNKEMRCCFIMYVTEPNKMSHASIIRAEMNNSKFEVQIEVSYNREMEVKEFHILVQEWIPEQKDLSDLLLLGEEIEDRITNKIIGHSLLSYSEFKEITEKCEVWFKDSAKDFDWDGKNYYSRFDK